MIIKKYLVSGLEEAKEVIANELGPKAQILNSRDIECHTSDAIDPQIQVEVIVGIEESDLHAFRKESGQPIIESSETKPLNELLDLCDQLIRHFDGESTLDIAEDEPKKSSSNALHDLIEKKILVQYKDNPLAPKIDDIFASRNINYFLSKGISYQAAQKVLDHLVEGWGSVNLEEMKNESDLYEKVVQELSSQLPTAGPLAILPGELTKVAIVGAAGIGKTTALFKIAEHLVEHQGKRVAILSLGSSKPGSVEELEAMSKAYDLPAIALQDVGDLDQAIQSFQNFDLLLIDSFGGGYHDESQFEAVQNLHEKIPDLQVIFSVNILSKTVDLFNQYQAFKRFYPKRILVSHLDETAALGPLVDLCEFTQLPLGYLVTDPLVTSGLEVADSIQLAKRILEGDHTWQNYVHERLSEQETANCP